MKQVATHAKSTIEPIIQYNDVTFFVIVFVEGRRRKNEERKKERNKQKCNKCVSKAKIARQNAKNISVLL